MNRDVSFNSASHSQHRAMYDAVWHIIHYVVKWCNTFQYDLIQYDTSYLYLIESCNKIQLYWSHFANQLIYSFILTTTDIERVTMIPAVCLSLSPRLQEGESAAPLRPADVPPGQQPGPQRASCPEEAVAAQPERGGPEAHPGAHRQHLQVSFLAFRQSYTLVFVRLYTPGLITLTC